MFNEKCNCGKPAKYSHFVDGNMVGSCNKHTVCKTYLELEKDLQELKSSYMQLLDAAESVTLYKEGTCLYEEAVETINSHIENF